MLKGGALVPLIANWPGKTAAGKVTSRLIDSTDFHPTFAELADVKLNAKTVSDGPSFVPQLRGTSQQPTREWIFMQLARQGYVRDTKWKLDQTGALYDMSKAPFEEPLGAPQPRDPAGGILDDGDGTGRHANGDENKNKNN